MNMPLTCYNSTSISLDSKTWLSIVLNATKEYTSSSSLYSLLLCSKMHYAACRRNDGSLDRVRVCRRMGNSKEGLSNQLSTKSTKSTMSTKSHGHKKKLRPKGTMPSSWFTLPTEIQAMEVCSCRLLGKTGL